MFDVFTVVADGAAPVTYLNGAITGIDFTAILNEITGVAPVLLPVAVACLAFRKGISFMFSILRGA